MTRFHIPVITIPAKDWPFALETDTVEELKAKKKMLEETGYTSAARACQWMIEKKGG